jgi:hypothetical protein
MQAASVRGGLVRTLYLTGVDRFASKRYDTARTVEPNTKIISIQ